MDAEAGPWDVVARRLLRKLRVPYALELDPAGVELRDALGTATVHDAVHSCAERALATADPRLATILRRCDLGGEAMKRVAADFHVSMRHFFRFRAELVHTVGAAVGRALESRVAVPAGPERAETLRALALAEYLLRRATTGDEPAAIAAAERALRYDPSLAAAWCVIAWAYVALALGSGLDAAVAYARAAAACERARELAPRSGAVTALRGALAWWMHGDAANARALAEDALGSPAGVPRGHYTLGWLAVCAGRFGAAERHFTAASAAEPAAWKLHAAATAAIALSGDHARAVQRCRELHEIEPGDAYVLGYYTEQLNALGRYQETVDAVAAAPAAARNFSVMTALARAHALLGDEITARRIARTVHGPAVSLAALALTLGDEDRMWRAFERARFERNGMLDLVPYDPVFAPVYDEPRLARVLSAPAV